MRGETGLFITMLGFFAACAWVVHIIVDGRRRRERLKIFTEFHGRLLDRIGSAKEFGEFLTTDGGVRFLDSLSIESGGAHVRILNAVQSGIVLVILGVSLFIAGGGLPDESPFKIICTIITALGVGLLLSAAASFVLSRRLGLLNGANRRTRNDSIPSA